MSNVLANPMAAGSRPARGGSTNSVSSFNEDKSTPASVSRLNGLASGWRASAVSFAFKRANWTFCTLFAVRFSRAHSVFALETSVARTLRKFRAMGMVKLPLPQ